MTGRNKEKKASLRRQISLAILALSVVISAGIGLIVYFTTASILHDSIDDSIKLLAVQGGITVAKEMDRYKAVVDTIANMEELTNDDPVETKMLTLKKETAENGYIRMTLVGLDGKGVTTEGKTPDLGSREYFKRAVAGKTNVSDPVVSVNDNSVVVVVAAPIKKGESVTGVLTATFDARILSDITNKIVYAKGGYSVLLSKSGVKIAHNNYDLVLKMDNDFENVKTNPSLHDLVNIEKRMVAGETGSGKYTYNGITKFMGYAPVPETDWTIGVTAPEKAVFERLYELRNVVAIMVVIFLLLSIIISNNISARIANPIMAMTDMVGKMAVFDLAALESEKIRKAARQTNEVGTIAKSILHLKNEFHDVIKGVREESQDVMNAVNVAMTEIQDLNGGIQDVSATTEQLSAGMEETAASTQELNATSTEIETAVESIAARAQEGAFTAAGISKRAAELSKSFSESQRNARAVLDRTSVKLSQALEESKSVEQINTLSDAIMQITTQTNLLALNAAIEAARAGETGKGFAVVADEIRKLAEDSKTAVTQIQQVIKTVVSSVENLTSSSNELLGFVSKDVERDYELMLHATEQYNDDATSVSNMTMDFSATSEELLASIQNMLKAIGEITSATNEGAEGTSNIAERSGDIVNRSGVVVSQVVNTQHSAEKLLDLVSKFKV